MIDTQLMKGILEGCVLSVIAEHETYGYEILQRLTESGFTENDVSGAYAAGEERLY